MIRFSPNPNRAHLIRWLEWGPEAFQKAEDQDKPIMLYLGAFWCAFCQDMDETSFSDEEVAALLNAYFVPVRVEDAQRPDIDIRYNQNGWPTIVFMTPWGDAMGAVNHMPPESFGNVLVRIHTAYREGRAELAKAAAADVAAPADVAGVQDPAAREKFRTSGVSEITKIIEGLADGVHGGYGPDHKFPHPEANDFLLYRYETTGNAAYLEHVALTLDKLRASETYDEKDGGFFRYSSKADWSEPHREKLLADHAGVLGNCLRLFRLTGRAAHQRLAEEIIEFLDGVLSDPGGAFYGCQDYLRAPMEKDGAPAHHPDKLYAVVDEWIYTDANARAVSAYFEASRVLERPDCRERALGALEFLWSRCRDGDGRLHHYYDGAPHVPGLLIDQVHLGIALLDSHGITGESAHLERAAQLGDNVLDAHANPAGGFYDIGQKGLAHLRFPLTLLAENGVAARFFLRLADAAKDTKYRRAALWALNVYTDDFAPYGVFAASYGHALGEYMALPILASGGGEEAARADPSA